MKPKRLKSGAYEYRGWTITPQGGYSMARHFSAYKLLNGKHETVWGCRLKRLCAMLDDFESGIIPHEVFRRPLYQ